MNQECATTAMMTIGKSYMMIIAVIVMAAMTKAPAGCIVAIMIVAMKAAVRIGAVVDAAMTGTMAVITGGIAMAMAHPK